MIANYAIVAIVLLFSGCGRVAPTQSFNATTDVIDSLLNNYDKRLRPNYGGGPVEVGITMYVISISSLSDVDMDFTMDIYFRQFWKDSRLAFEKKPGFENIKLGHEFGKMIWVPDTFFVNEKESFIHTLTTKNEFVRIDHTGEIKRSVRLSVTASCPMNFKSFPMDTQVCSLDIESYSHNANGMKFFWREPDHSIGVSDDLTLNLFEFVKQKEITQNIQFIAGNYSRLAAEFEFKRLWMHYVPQVYIPCSMFVILSWITFWLKKCAFNARLMICTLSLVMMTVGCQVFGTQIPKTAYAKGIDIYTGVCMTFVFTALVVFAYICNQSTEDDKDNELRSKTSKVDKWFQIAFPIAFLLFNMIYWIVY